MSNSSILQSAFSQLSRYRKSFLPILSYFCQLKKSKLSHTGHRVVKKVACGKQKSTTFSPLNPIILEAHDSGTKGGTRQTY